MMKKLSILLALMLVFGLLAAGCQKEEAPASSSVPVQSTPPAEQKVEGTVADGTSMNVLQITTANGATYSFGIEDAEIDAGEAGITIGADVVVHYTGELNPETEEQDVTVVRVVVMGAGVQSVDGLVTDISKGTLTIRTIDQASYAFDTQNAEIEIGRYGLILNDEVTVTYTGTLADTAGVQDVQVSRVTVIKEPEGSIEGIVTDATMNMVEITTAKGVKYAFPTEGVSVEPAGEGLLLGDDITVYFQGGLSRVQEMQPVGVERIVVNREAVTSSAASSSSSSHTASKSHASSSEAASGSQSDSDSSSGSSGPSGGTPASTQGPGPVQPGFVTGEVAAVDSDTVTITTEDDTSFTFTLPDEQNIEVGRDGILEGYDVSVYYFGTLDPDADTQDVTVAHITKTGWAGHMVVGDVTALDDVAGTLTLEVTSKSGHVYEVVFKTYGSTVDPNLGDTVREGQRVCIYYLGTCSPSAEVQDVQVVLIGETGTL